MSSVHNKYARSLINLCEVHNEHYVTAGIDLDGGVMQYFFDFINEVNGLRDYQDDLENTVHISSKSNDIDEITFSNILAKAYESSSDVVFFDARTVTGSLGKIIKEKVSEWNRKNEASVKSLYAVLFDPRFKADLRGSEEELSDEERKEIYWVKGEYEVRKLIHQEDGIWKYNLTKKIIGNFEPVPLIKKEIILLLS